MGELFSQLLRRLQTIPLKEKWHEPAKLVQALSYSHSTDLV